MGIIPTMCDGEAGGKAMSSSAISWWWNECRIADGRFAPRRNCCGTRGGTRASGDTRAALAAAPSAGASIYATMLPGTIASSVLVRTQVPSLFFLIYSTSSVTATVMGRPFPLTGWNSECYRHPLWSLRDMSDSQDVRYSRTRPPPACPPGRVLWAPVDPKDSIKTTRLTHPPDEIMGRLVAYHRTYDLLVPSSASYNMNLGNLILKFILPFACLSSRAGDALLGATLIRHFSIDQFKTPLMVYSTKIDNLL